MRLGVKLRVGSQILADDSYTVVAGEVHRRIALSDPGIDDFRNELLWSRLADDRGGRFNLWADPGELLDEVRSTPPRTLAIQGDRIVLNGRPSHLRMSLPGLLAQTG